MRALMAAVFFVAAAANLQAIGSAAVSSNRCPEVLPSPVWSAGSASTGLHLSADKTGCFTVSADGKPWLVSGATSISVNLIQRSNHNGTLSLVNVTTSRGADGLGPYTRVAWEWTAPSMAPGVGGLKGWVTSIKAYTRHDDASDAAKVRTVVFGQSFGDTARGFPGSGQWGAPGSSFPSFDSTVGPLSTGDLATLTFHNQGDSLVSNATQYGRAPWGGMTGGVPLALFDSQARTAVVSPLENFLSTVFNQVDGQIVCGPEGRANHIPAGHKTAVILHYGQGISKTFLEWGDKLLYHHGKRRATDDTNVQVERLGYSTVGHYFYGITVGKTAEQTMHDVAAYASKLGLPYGWYLLDSWWYGEGSTPLPNGTSLPGYGGTWRWDDEVARRPGAFPSGLRSLTDDLGAPLVMHMGQLVGNSSSIGPPPYATDPAVPGQSSWVVEPHGSLPLGNGSDLFWDSLFANASDWGLAVFKLDHAESQIPDMSATQDDVNAVETWLTQMTTAAAKHGIAKEYGGCFPSMFLHSVTLPTANQARVGGDYIPGTHRSADACSHPNASSSSTTADEWLGRGSARIGRNSLFPWSVGIRPYKDAFLSGRQDWSQTTCTNPGQGWTKPEWWGLQDAYPATSAAVSAMAAGPIADCDGVGSSNATLIMRLARADGVTLKPSRPAFVVDSTWVREGFGYPHVPAAVGPEGELTHTYTELAGECWHFALGFDLHKPYRLSAGDLVGCGGESGLKSHLAWQEVNGKWDDAGPQLPPTVGAFGNGLEVPTGDGGTSTLWRTAPRLCNGTSWAVLGELSKFISMSRQRIGALDSDCAAKAVRLTLLGAPGEEVELWFVAPTVDGTLLQPEAHRCTILPTGQTTVSMPGGHCAQG